LRGIYILNEKGAWFFNGFKDEKFIYVW
jgi:hypothetical protein